MDLQHFGLRHPPLGKEATELWDDGALAQLGVVSPNRRKFRQPNSSPATIASRSMTWPSP